MAKLVTVAYVGKKESQEDTIAGTGILWLPGSQHDVTEEQAKILAVHTDSWEIVGVSETEEAQTKKPDAKKKDDDEPKFTMVNLDTMTKQELADYATREFHEPLDMKSKKDDLIAQIRNLQQSRG